MSQRRRSARSALSLNVLTGVQYRQSVEHPLFLAPCWFPMWRSTHCDAQIKKRSSSSSTLGSAHKRFVLLYYLGTAPLHALQQITESRIERDVELSFNCARESTEPLDSG